MTETQEATKIQITLDGITGKVEKVTDAEGNRLAKVKTGEPSAKFIDADSITVVRTNPCIWIKINGVWYCKCWK